MSYASNPYVGAPYAVLAPELVESAVATDAVPAPEFLMVAEPWDPHGAGGVDTVYAAARGYVSLPDGTGLVAGVPDDQLFRGVIVSPANVSVKVLSAGGFAASALPTMGQLVLANGDRVLDDWLRMDWRRRRVRVWVGESAWIGPSFGTFQQRLTAAAKGISADQDTVTLALEPWRSLDVEVNDEAYGGFGGGLRLNYVAASVSKLMDADDFVPSASSFTVRVRVRKVDRSLANNTFVSQKYTNAGTDPGWNMYILPSSLRANLSDGTTQKTIASSSGSLAFPDSTLDWQDLFLVVDRDPSTEQAYLYMNREFVGSTDTSTLGAILPGQPVQAGCLAAGFSPGIEDLDEFCLWNRALSITEMDTLWGAPTPNDSPGLVAAYHLDEGTGTSVFNNSEAVGARDGLELRGGAYVEFPGVQLETAKGLAVEIEASLDPSHGDVHTLFGKGQPIGGVSPGFLLIQSPFLPTDGLIAYANDGTTDYLAQWSWYGVDGFDVSLPHRYAVEIDRVDDVMRLLVDGVERASVSIAGAGSLDGSEPLRIGVDGGGLYPMEGRVSDFRAWSAPRTDKEYAYYAWRRITGFEPDLRIYARCDDSAGTTVTDTSVHGDDGDIDDTAPGSSYTWYDTHASLAAGVEGTDYSWVGSLEGGGDLAGKRKRRAYGVRRQVRGDLVDAQRVVYQVTSLPCEELVPYLSGGATLTYAGDYDDPYDWDPQAGYYITTLARGLVRMHSLHSGEVTFLVRGDTRRGYTEVGAQVMSHIAQDAGLVVTDIDTVSVSALAAARPGALGVITGREKATAADLLSQLARTLDAWWTFDMRDGRLTLQARDEPGDPELEIDDGMVAAGKAKRSDSGRVVAGVRVLYAEHEVTHNLEDVTGSLPESERVQLTEQWRAVDSPRLSGLRHQDAEVVEVSTLYDLETDARDDAARRFAIDSVPRAQWDVTLAEVSYRLRVGMTVKLTLPQADLDQGRNLLVGGISEDERNNTMTLNLWGTRDIEDQS